MRGWVRLTTLTVVLEAVAFGTPETAEAAPICSKASWQTLRSASRGGGSELLAVTALSKKDAWAVGWSSHPVTEATTPMSQHWDGEAWEIVPTETAGVVGLLHGVDAASSTDVWAVGSRLTELQTSASLALHWDGRAWERIRMPKPQAGRFVSAVPTDVAMIDADDVWAVGYWSTVPDAPPSPFIEHWNGRRWKPVDNPVLGTWSELHGVAATGPDDVWAVGNTEVQVGDDALVERALIEHWDGKAWTVVRSPVVGRLSAFGLESVDARSASDAWAVGEVAEGSTQETLSFHWDGDRWSRVPTVDPSNEFQLLGGVAAASRNRVWAVGYYWDAARERDSTLVLRWDGHEWTKEPSENHRSGNQLSDVAALPSRQFAVGSFWANGGEGPQRTLVVGRCPG
jgi:hypothetical protein